MSRFRRNLHRSISLLACALLLGGVQSRTINLQERLLAAHNVERVSLGLEPLFWDEKLSAGAADWANFLASTGRFEHSPNVPGESAEGENIWGGTPDRFTPEGMVGLWLREKKDFRTGIFPANSMTGRVADVSHYTQIIWRDTHAVGCALAQGQREEILVCRYSRPGNVIGRAPI